jgi:hypothetical protein
MHQITVIEHHHHQHHHDIDFPFCVFTLFYYTSIIFYVVMTREME